VNAITDKPAPVEVINKIVHQKILADMERVRETANVPEKFIRNSMKSYCHDEVTDTDFSEIEWVRQFNFHRRAGSGGLAMIGTPHAQTRCMAITGTLVRNFIDARIMSLNMLVENPAGAREPTVLVVPNLYVHSLGGKQLTAWQAQTVYDVFLTRLTSNKPCVVYIENAVGFKDAYGAVFAEHINTHFLKA
jgi:hypothetical protein